jgi:hypothetical protein
VGTRLRAVPAPGGSPHTVSLIGPGQADPAGRTAEQIADEAYDTFNDHPRDPDGADLACGARE